MAASLLASFMIFAVIGAFVLFSSGLEFACNPAIKFFIALTLLSNACFYHYIEAYTEMDDEVKRCLISSDRKEWVVRVINHALILSLWFMLQIGWLYFGATLLFVYLTYFYWDYLTWNCFKSHFVFYLDLAGFVITLLFIIWGSIIVYVTTLGDTMNFFWGVISLLYLLLALLGTGICYLLTSFNPFSKKFMTRPLLH